MPDELTWFYWEAYATWLSGFALVIVVYYLDADLFLVDKSVLDLSPVQAGLFSLVSLALAWLLYEAACRSKFAKQELAFVISGYVFLVALTFAFTHVLSGRGAFNQIGAIIGTIMVANVFLIIIPNQRKTVAALIAGEKPDPSLRHRRQAALGPQQLPDLAGHPADDQQSLSAALRHPLQLGDRRHRARARTDHPALLQQPACRQGIAVVDLGRRRRGHDRDRLPLRGGSARGRDRRRDADLQDGGEHHLVPLQHVPCGGAGVGLHPDRAARRPAGRSPTTSAATPA